MDTASIIGYFAGAITTIAFVPQFIKIWKTKSTKDLSHHVCGFLPWGFPVDDIRHYTAFQASDHCQFNWLCSANHHYNSKN